MDSRRWTAALAVTAAAALLAGCGGGGGSARLTKAQYEQRVQADAKALTTATAGLSNMTSVSDVTKLVSSAQASLEKAASDLESLKPPQEAESANKAFVAALRELKKDFADIATAFKSGDITKVTAVVQRLGSSKTVAAAKKAAVELEKKGYKLGAFGSS